MGKGLSSLFMLTVCYQRKPRKELKAGAWRQNGCRGNGGVLYTDGLDLRDVLSLLAYTTQDDLPGVVPPSGLGPPISITDGENVP